MTDTELRELVAGLAVAQRETDRQLKETDRRQKETDRQLKETDRRQKETDRQLKETDRRQKKTDHLIRELGRQIGGLGNKFGTFAEGLAHSSIERILTEEFGLREFLAPDIRLEKPGGRWEQYDFLAYSNGELHKGMIVEVKTKLRGEDVGQMRRKMEEVFQWLPDHCDKTFYGMVAFFSGNPEVENRIIKNGWYLAHVGEDLFELIVPEGFQPRAYTAA